MKEHFSENFRPTEDEIKGIWADAIFVFDTNVLLNLYRMRLDTSEKIRGVLRKLKGRLFLPYQVGVEFFRHRENEIAKQVNTFEHVRASLAKIPVQFKQAFSRHPCIPITQITDALRAVTEQQIAAVTESQKTNELNFLVAEDPILPDLQEIFGDCAQGAYTKANDDALNKKVEDRVQGNLPPCAVSNGGKGLPPPASNPHRGDGRVWFQILDHAEKTKKPFIFVTADGQLNWWRTVQIGQHDKIIGPHFLLIRDIENASGKRFAMYTQEGFLENAPKYLDVPDQSEAIEESKQLRENDELDKDARQADGVEPQREGSAVDDPKRASAKSEKDGKPPVPVKQSSSTDAGEFKNRGSTSR